MRATTIALAAALAFAAGAPTSAAEPADPRLRAVESWAFAIGNGTLRGDLARRYGGFDLIVVDGEEVRRRQVRELQDGGALVLGYLSVGTIERWRSWYPLLERFRLEAWKQWRDEFYADVRARGFRRRLVDRIAPALLAKGLDGLFLDNTDMIETHPRQKRGMRRLIAALDRRVDPGGGLLFAQNGAAVIGPSLSHLDGWNREDVSFTYDFARERYRRKRPAGVAAAQRELERIAGSGLLVTATDYLPPGRKRAQRRAIANACAAGALPYVSDIGLRRVPARPLRC